MNKKIIFLIALVVIMIIGLGYFVFLKGRGKIQPSQMETKIFCQTDDDCACGVDKETGKCAYGNKNFIDTSKQCPDFCTGIAGNIRIRCINNLCTAVLIR
ncbi:MAG: hypothetical protein QW244_02020 [Candidatus Pacearchaeota archaeon]